MARKRPSLHAGSLRQIVLPYMALSALWILFSDRLLYQLVSDPSWRAKLSIAKGWLFVLVTALLLHGLVVRLLARLRSSSETLRAMIEASPLAILLVGPDGRVQSWNGAAERLFALPAAAVVGKPLALFHGDRPERFQELYRQVSRGESLLGLDLVVPRADGAPLPISMNVSPVLGESGQVQGMVAIIADMGERKKAEAVLSESEARFRSTFEQGPIGMALVGLDRRFLQVNRTLCRLIGCAADELVGHDFLEITHPDDIAASTEYIRQVVAAALPLEGIEKRYRRKDGGLIWALTSVSLVRNERHQPLYFVAQIQDITARRQALEALQESEERYRQLVELSQDAILVHQQGRIVFANPAAMRIFGAGAGRQLLGTPVMDLIHPDFRATAGERIRQALERNANAPLLEEQLLRLDGTAFAAEVTANRFLFRDQPAVQVIAHDISERKRAEAQHRELEAQLIQNEKLVTLGTLAAGVAHEINNPNNFIMMNAEIFSRTWADVAPVLEEHARGRGGFTVAGLPFEKARSRLPALLDGLVDGARRIQEIVADLKEYAAPEKAAATEEVDVNHALRSAVMLTRNLVQRSTRDFTIEFAPDLPPVAGSLQKLEQVFINLIQNACQALTDPGQAVAVSSRRLDASGQVEVRVSDRGRGIPGADLPHVTDPFFTTHRAMGGTGLGLSICQRIVADHGGSLRFDSQPGRGTTVTVALPARGAAAAAGPAGVEAGARERTP